MTEVNRIPDSARQQMVAFYLSGMTAKEAGERVGYSPNTCLRSVRASGHDVRRHGMTYRSQPTPMLSAVQKAYLAGIIDGEGFLGLVRTKQASGRTGYCAHLSIGMTHEELLAIREEVGFGDAYSKVKRNNPNHKPCYVWRLSANCCRVLLPMLLPYLRFKKRQAELLLEYLSLSKHCNRRDLAALETYHRKVRSIYDALRCLNRKGVQRGVEAR